MKRGGRSYHKADLAKLEERNNKRRADLIHKFPKLPKETKDLEVEPFTLFCTDG